MANKNTQNDWDENINTQETPDVRATISIAEDEVFLRDLFGIQLPENAMDADLARKIAHRVVNVIDQTRTSIDRNGLQRLLSRNIQDGLNRASSINRREVMPSNRPGPLLDTQRMKRIRVVCEAIRESVPSAVMKDLISYGLPSFIPENGTLQQHVVSLGPVMLKLSDRSDPRTPPTRTSCRVEIDTRHAFWRQKYPFTRPVFYPPNPGVDALKTELVRALVTERKTFATLGIRILNDATQVPVSENAIIEDDASIDALLAGQARGIDLTKRYEDIVYTLPRTTPPTAPVTFRVNTGNLIRFRVGRFPTDLIASFNDPARLQSVLQTNPEVRDFVSVDPSGTPVTNAQWGLVAAEVFRVLRPAGTGALAVTDMNLRNIQDQIGEQHRFHTSLREGSDNQMGAAFASSILMKYKDIRDTLNVGNEQQTLDNLATERQRLSLVKLLDSLSSLSFSIPFSLTDATTRRAECLTSRGNLLAGGVLTVGGESYTIPTIPNATQQLDAIQTGRKWIEDKEKEINQVETECRNLAAKLRPVVQTIFSITGSHGVNPSIMRLFDATTYAVRPSEFTQNISVSDLIEGVRSFSDIRLRNAADHEAESKRLNEQLEKIRKNEIPKGDRAQHLVIKEYLKRYQGMTDDEATRGANVIRGRSQLDTETVEHINYISDSLHGSYEEDEVTDDTILGHPERDITRMQNVAREAHIPLNANRYPAWGTARNYKDLMGAYFALRKMRDGSGVPWMMRLNNTAVVRRELREITRAILQNHLKAMLQDFGSGLNISDDEQKLILKDPTKPEHSDTLMQILSGEIPPQHQATVEKILSRADKRTFRYRRNAGNALFGENWGAITGNKLGVSGKNLLYGNKHWSVVGGATGAKNLTVKTTKGLWAKKAPIAKIAALSMLGGPLGLAIGVGLFGKEFSKAKASGSVGSSH